jgi:hypothetical protein
VASRLLQFLRSFLEVLINCPANEFCHRSTSPFRQRFKLLDLVFLEEERRTLHGHILAYRHMYVNL